MHWSYNKVPGTIWYSLDFRHTCNTWYIHFDLKGRTPSYKTWERTPFPKKTKMWGRWWVTSLRFFFCFTKVNVDKNYYGLFLIIVSINNCRDYWQLLLMLDYLINTTNFERFCIRCYVHFCLRNSMSD